MKKSKACLILQLPDHILVEIFSRISLKSLTQCRSVCKSWHSFFRDPQITKDLFSRTQQPSFLLIYGSTERNDNITSKPGNDDPYHEDYFYYLIEFDDKASTKPRRRPKRNALMPCPKNLEVSYCVDIVGSCNGLVCLNDLGLRIYISNPMTSEFSLLPTAKTILKKYSVVLGFGFSPIFNVYKVLDIYTKDGYVVEAMVMTLGSGIWRSVDANHIMTLFGKRQLDRSVNGICLYMTYLNCCLHWLVSSNNGSLLIYAFDLETEQIEQLPHYDFESGDVTCSLGVLRGCLSVLVPNSRGNGNASVWMMKDYGVEESWTLEYEIHGFYMDVLPTTKLLKLTEEEEVVVLLNEMEKELKVYGPGTTSSKIVEVNRTPVAILGACDYIPNFVSLNTIFGGKGS